MEQGNRSQERYDDAQAGGEALENVVRVLDDKGSEQTTEDLSEHGGPRPNTKVIEKVSSEPARCSGIGIVRRREDDGHNGGKQREEGELHVAHPQVPRGILEHHLEVDTSQARREACRNDSHETLERIHVLRGGRGMLMAARLYLHDANADSQEQQGEPFDRAELLAQQHN